MFITVDIWSDYWANINHSRILQNSELSSLFYKTSLELKSYKMKEEEWKLKVEIWRMKGVLIKD